MPTIEKRTAHAKPPSNLSRREFLALASACSAQLALMSLAGPGRAKGFDVVISEPWGHIEKLADGIWAVVSTPLEHKDWTTLCNGGIIAGRDRVLVVESFYRADGARWVAEQAEALAGRPPTDVVLTHYHGDHAGGIQGYDSPHGRPAIRATAKTLELIREADSRGDEEEDPVRRDMLDSVEHLDSEQPTELDLGGRRVILHPRAGHTASDVTIELDEPSVVFFGDLLWNGLFPNYRDTIPSILSRSIHSALRDRDTVYVPGHGNLPERAAIDHYLELIDDIEAAARQAYEKGIPAADAAKSYKLPDSVHDWYLFNDRYFEVAIGAWHKELGGSG